MPTRNFVKLTQNSRINPVHMEKNHRFGYFLWSVLEFRFVNNKFQWANAKVSPVTRKEKQ